MLYVICKLRDFWRAFIWHMITKKSGSSRVMVGKKYPQPQCLC